MPSGRIGALGSVGLCVAGCSVALLLLVPTDVDDEPIVENRTGARKDPALEVRRPLLI